MDKHGQYTGLTTHEETTGAGGDGEKETWTEENEENDSEEHFGFST